MKKRLLSGLLAALILISLFPAALAVAPNETDAAQVLAALDIMVGDENGNLQLDRSVTRAEFVKMIMATSGVSVGSVTAVSPYPDVSRTYWAAPYVEAAVTAGYVTGYLDGTFRPGNSITLAEAVVMSLRLLGYSSSDFSGAYPAGQMALYRTLELDEGISAGQNDAITRRDAMYLLYNLLTAQNKSGQVYLTSLGYSALTASGEIDTLALINAKMEGPVVMGSSGWQSKIPFDLTGAKVVRDGVTSSSSALTQSDVIYWSKSMRTLWVYTDRNTGSIETIAPNTASPTSVTVAGKTYALETSSAAWALSDLGSYRVGDTVTLLMGRAGGVAAVVSPTQSSASVIGMITAVATSTYTDAKGKDYTANTVTVTATDGNSYSYRSDKTSWKTGTLVRATVSGSSVQLSVLTSASLTGSVNTAGTKLGSYTFASDAEILDVSGKTQAKRIYPSRLAGVKLTDRMVKYYMLNNQGEISRLILNDVTGDLHSYGMLTGVSDYSYSMSVSVKYTYDIGGISSTLLSDTQYNSAEIGPVQIRYDEGAVDNIVALTELKSITISGNSALCGNASYPLSDTVAVYECKDGDYYLSTLAAVSGGDYTLTGWYDKEPSQGGCVRVIIAD
jgi:hypothetical protein